MRPKESTQPAVIATLPNVFSTKKTLVMGEKTDLDITPAAQAS